MSILNFDSFCSQISLPICPLVGNQLEPTCYSRNVELGPDALMFQPATLLIYVVALIMTGIMIYHIKSKYTAVGRKEIVMFFYNYILLILLELSLVSGLIQVSKDYYPWFVAAHVGLITTQFWILLLNGFVGFQWAEDGTPASIWSIRISSLVMFSIVFFLSIATFNGLLGFSPENPIAVFVVYFILNPAMLLIYTIMQVVLVINTLDDRWPLGDILFGLIFFILGQIVELALSNQICEAAQHYIDGLFFGNIFSLLGVMMVYKYWDSITKEDLEFSVGGKANVWEIGDGADFEPVGSEKQTKQEQ